MKKSVQIFAMAIVAVAFLTSAATTGYKVGDTVKDFSLKNIDGKMVSLKDYNSAKGAIVIFTCNHCPYAKAYEQRVIALDKMYKSKGYPVIAINPNDVVAVPDDSFDNMVKNAKEKGYTFPYLLDETQQVARQFGAAKTPHVFVLNKTDKGYDVAYIGAIDDNTEDAGAVQHKYVEDAVNALIAGKSVPVTTTKAVGCTIKWKS
ncbi:MAG: thioredoxin family protein [Chitinophagaceae bacterium]|nr:thioredoxin family protein [Chitinophagaceae bacterium]